MEHVRLIFIISENYSVKEEVGSIMQEAFESCKQNVNVSVEWVRERDFDSLNLNKSDFVIFEDFSGKLFNRLQETKCVRILGPWAVSVCLIEGKAIPNFSWPIYNVAMYNCVVSCSALSKDLKIKIKEKVELMGGCYVNTLCTKNTHLITNSAKSEKYLKAAEAGVKLMDPSWVEEVWKVSQDANIHANDEQFNKHRCLPLCSLTICSTGLNPAERKNIENLVNQHGGKFTAHLTLKHTDILICEGDISSSAKFKAARQNSIKCVTVDWLYDSIEKGYALSHVEYQFQKVTSTPTKPDDPVNPEFSILSAITGPNMSQRGTIEDTFSSPISSNIGKSTVKRKVDLNDYNDLVDKLDIKKAKKAGPYLDGCSVYLTGFNAEHTEKLNKIINLSGATRYDVYSDRVTHVIVGDSTFHEVKIITSKKYSSLLVTIQWLIDSIEHKHPANEERYLVNVTHSEKSGPGSPLCKRGLSLLRSHTFTEQDLESVAPPEVKDDSHHQEIIQQYFNLGNSNAEEDTLAKLLINANVSQRSNISSAIQRSADQALTVSTQESSISVTQTDTEQIQIFEHLKFLVLGFDDEEAAVLTEKIESFSGELVPKTYKGIPNFAVLPMFQNQDFHHAVTEIVNELFVFECEQKQELIQEISYYHRPLQLPSIKPLSNCVITLTCYQSFERTFLRNLVEVLGGVFQEQFARVTSVAKGVIASTHLVSPEATGRKYEAALKWGLPVITKDWLLECAKTGRYINEEGFLVGESKTSEIGTQKDSSKSLLNHSSINVSKSKSTNLTPTNTPGPVSKKVTPQNKVTPFHKRCVDSAEKPFSQVTPISKIMQNFRENNLNSATPKKYEVLQPWTNMKTPDTPLGSFLTPNPSPNHKKQWEYWLTQFNDTPSPKSNKSTPLSEIKKQLWNKALRKKLEESECVSQGSGKEVENEENVHNTLGNPTTPENQQLANRLEQLESLLTSSGGHKRRSNFQTTISAAVANVDCKGSQPCTVGWDYELVGESTSTPKMKIFSLSGISENDRNSMVTQIESLGGSVSDLTNYDPSCTHLLCPKPARNEKSLSCMAAGKWVLHVSYLEKSIEAGKFLNEEEYEFGNPKSFENIPASYDRDTETRIQKMHWWRKEISKRGYGAFNDMRAIVVAQKREPIMRVIEAGGGTIVDARPPFNEPVHATHCLLEQKSVQDFTLYIPLAEQGIYLVNTIFINDYLHNPSKNARDCILPYFTKYYAGPS